MLERARLLVALLPLALLLLAAPLAAQEDLRTLARRISAETLSTELTMKHLEELCRVAPGRLAGTEACDRAVEWAVETMRDLGLENVRLEPVMVPKWVRGDRERLIVVEPKEFAGQELPILALGGSIGTPARGITAEVIRVTSFPELEKLSADDVSGKIVRSNLLSASILQLPILLPEPGFALGLATAGAALSYAARRRGAPRR